ncbi:MAG: RusA family crossover junction endodeoxyribonuclease [Planctomycetes bacterium]|nr:RusA family crossover junction endodeoxyribonuclease [Planctomycetota bacterium]
MLSNLKGEAETKVFPGEPKTLVFVLPLPPRELSPNARPHHMAKARAVRKYRLWAWAEARSQNVRPGWAEAKAQATFHFTSNRRRDRDNLLASLKPAFDGLVDAGVLADDSGLTHLPVRIELDANEPRVEICIER